MVSKEEYEKAKLIIYDYEITKHKDEIKSNFLIPPPPEPPLDRVLIEGGSYKICQNCGSSVVKNGFLRLFGEYLCINKRCINSKSKFK